MSPILALAMLAGLHGTPFPQVRPDETLIFFPTEAWRTPDGGAWEVHIHGWIFEIEWRRNLLGPAYDALDLHDEATTQPDDEGDDDEATNTVLRELFIRRASPFLVDNQGGKRVKVKLGERIHELPPSASDGHFQATVRVSAAEIEILRRSGELAGDWLAYRAVLPDGDKRFFQGKVRLIEPSGISVISDIDDTVKVTNVDSRKENLRNTFLLPFAAIEGMPELYSAWARRQDVVFHYVSMSPWQLYEPLAELLGPPRFPPATFHLRRFQPIGFDLWETIKPDSAKKTDVVKDLIRRFPGRRFVLIGDSGERDPEIYSQLAIDHPGQIVRIFIRDPREDENAPRYGKVFASLPKGTAMVFRNPSELADRLPASMPTSRPTATRFVP